MSKKSKTDMLSEEALDKVSGGTEIADNERLKINHNNFDTSIKFNNVDTKLNFNNVDTSIKINNKSDIKILKND